MKECVSFAESTRLFMLGTNGVIKKKKKKHPCPTSYSELEQHSRQKNANAIAKLFSARASRGQAAHTPVMQQETCAASQPMIKGEGFYHPSLRAAANSGGAEGAQSSLSALLLSGWASTAPASPLPN